jgi:hypothetical protein
MRNKVRNIGIKKEICEGWKERKTKEEWEKVMNDRAESVR